MDVPTGIKSVKPGAAPLVSLLSKNARQPRRPEETVTTASDEQGALVGRILVIPYEENAEARARQIGMLAEVRRRLIDAAHHRGGASTISSIEEHVRAHSPGQCTVNFTLMRTGEARLWFATEHASLNEEEHEQLARQAYFFLKDMTHRHVHHDQLDDQITPLIRFKNSTAADRRDSEIAWRRETLWSLSRVADKRMGSDKLNDLREALGMLAYADAFQNSLLPYVRDANDALAYVPNKSAYGFDFQHIRESTRVRIDQTAARRTVTGQLVAAIFAGAIGSLSLLTSLISAHNAQLTTDDTVRVAVWEWLLRALGEYPLAVMVISAYVLYSAFALTLSDILFTRPRRSPQALRGWTLSLAKKRGLTPSQTYRLLITSYLAIIGVMFVILIGFVAFVSMLPSDLGLSALKSKINWTMAWLPCR